MLCIDEKCIFFLPVNILMVWCTNFLGHMTHYKLVTKIHFVASPSITNALYCFAGEVHICYCRTTLSLGKFVSKDEVGHKEL